MKEKAVYPFTAIVGQESMKLALILNLINPALGGVLIRGEKGTAKSTAVRGLCALMDEVEVSKGCRFHCRVDEPALLCDACKAKAAWEKERYTRRVVELPISATEDRVVGALNMEKAIKQGEKEFEPGILAEANGNIVLICAHIRKNRQKKSAINAKMKETIMAYLTDYAEAKASSIAEYIGLKPSRTRDYLNELVAEGIVVAEGGNRNRSYKLKS